MPREYLSSLDDRRLDVYRDLPRTNLTRTSGLFIAEGRLLVERLLASRYPVESIVLDDRFADLELPVAPEVPVLIVRRGQVSDLVGFRFHRGVLACGRRLPWGRLDDCAVPPPRPMTVVAAVDIHDPENMGAILRNSAAFGVDLVLASDRCADPFSRRVLRTSMGAGFRVALIQSPHLHEELTRLRDEFQVMLVATVLDTAAAALCEYQRPGRLALLFGNEGHGLATSTIELCQGRITIPMHQGTDSLNVSVASGIVLFQLMRGFEPVR